MRPRTLSATSLETYEQCAMRFAAETQGKRLNVASPPADFGTAMHATLDKYVERLYDTDGYPIDGAGDHDPEMLYDIWQAAANTMLPFGTDYVDEGYALLVEWVKSRELPKRVLSREIKERFDIEVPGFDGATQAITYICDRVDETAEGIEVIDYKTQYERVNAAHMRRLIQPNLYALAMRKRYEVDNVAVTYDLVRYDPITVYFNAAQMDGFERYLQAAARRVWLDDDPREAVNKGCKWCMRKSICTTFQRAVELQYTPAMSAEDLAAMRDTAKHAKKAFEVLLDQVDEVLLEHMRREDTDLLDAGEREVRATTRRTEKYDPEVVLRVLGTDALPFMTVGKTALEKEFKRREGRFAAEQIAAVRDMSAVTHGDPQIEVTAKGQPSE